MEYNRTVIEIKKREIEKFQREILEWFEENKRDLPWREIPDGISLQDRAYRILVSEVMLQQTQVNRVIPKYEAWLMAFPTVKSLAKASISDVLGLWSGLGYNRRAVYLKKTAEILVSNYSSRESRSSSQEFSTPLRGVRTIINFPQDEKTLRSLPGIGEYTARAILCFAFNHQVAVVDTNVRKILLLKVFKEIGGTKEPKEVKEMAKAFLPKDKAYEWNQALMDYSSAVLSKEKVPLKKQSAFKTSNRYFRGQIIKVLLEHKTITASNVSLLFKKLYGKEDSRRLASILLQLEKDTLIKREKGIVQLP